jgi:ABC-type multidrug transport system fused ATPase/permease subunit
MDYENTSNENENYTLDIFNNFDKIISRGQSNFEMGKYNEQSEIAIEKSKIFFEQSHINNSVMTTFIYLVILGCLYYLVVLKRDDKIKTPAFISLFTVILMYRDRFTVLLGSIPSMIEMTGRIEYASELLKDLKHDLYSKMPDSNYEPTFLSFDRIDFQGVYYKYKTSDKYLFEDLNLTIVPNNNIVGITGLSGRGKSTIMKLLLRLYPLEKGTITIDGKDIHTIDPIYIRKNITYINQSAKLFNKRIIENMMYGCNSEEECKKYLDMIMEYPKIKGLYANVDLINGSAGSLGENLSGGQRQIINIISGLINPSPILVLDEPTNALDAELKSELLAIIDRFRNYKKCIIIITHDRDVYPLFDSRIKL